MYQREFGRTHRLALLWLCWRFEAIRSGTTDLQQLWHSSVGQFWGANRAERALGARSAKAMIHTSHKPDLAARTS